MRRLPLQGIVVADFSRVLAGPLCTQMLGDAGADVIKIEEPERGDETRHWGPPFLGGISTYFLSINRNKRSLAVDLKRGGEVARELIARADVVVDNFLPAQRATLKLDRAREINPRAIHCSIRGYDSDSPDAMTPGYDLLAQAGAGLMAITGETDGDPMKIGVALSDVLTAHHAYGAITTALFARERTGEGTSIEVSLFSATIASLVNVAQAALATGQEARRYGNAHPSIVPYQLFHAKDRAFALGAGTDRHFRALCGIIDRPELSGDQRFINNTARVKHRGTLVGILGRAFKKEPAAFWIERCRAAAIPVALVQGVREAIRTQNARPLIVSIDHPLIGSYEAVGNPLRIDGQRLPARIPPPQLGEHTDEILRELGYARGDINRLRRKRIIGPRATSGKESGNKRG